MSRHILVELEGGLDQSRFVGIWHALRLIPGVHAVCDLEAISAETLTSILLKPEPEPVVRERMRQMELA